MKNTKKLLSVLAAVILVVGAIAAPAMTVGAASTTPALSIDYCNLAFEDTVHIKYAVASDTANVSVLVWTSPAASYTYGTHTSELTAYTTETIGGEEYKVFTYDKLAAKQMTDVVYAAAYANIEGAAYYSPINKYSVLQYAYNMMGKTAAGSSDTELVALLGDMLSYGASAQKYFNYNETRLADASFYQVKLTDGTLSDGCTHGLYIAGDSVTMTAPETNEAGVAFGYWADSTGASVATTAEYTLTVTAKNETYTPVYGASAGGDDGNDEYTEPTIVVDSVSANAGATVQVPVNVVNNPGVAGATITVSYNTALTLTSASAGEAFSALTLSAPGQFVSPCNFTWDSESGESKTDGTILYLNFTVPANAAVGDTFEISCSYRSGDVFNDAWDDVEFDMIGGKITVK